MRLVPLLCVLALSSVACHRAAAEGFTNLQILPKNITREQLKLVMKDVTKSLGVECDFCHDPPDMASDKVAKKKIARQMMKMTDEINAKWFKDVAATASSSTAGTPAAPARKVGCMTCHRGQAEPKP